MSIGRDRVLALSSGNALQPHPCRIRRSTRVTPTRRALRAVGRGKTVRHAHSLRPFAFGSPAARSAATPTRLTRHMQTCLLSGAAHPSTLTRRRLPRGRARGSERCTDLRQAPTGCCTLANGWPVLGCAGRGEALRSPWRGWLVVAGHGLIVYPIPCARNHILPAPILDPFVPTRRKTGHSRGLMVGTSVTTCQRSVMG